MTARLLPVLLLTLAACAGDPPATTTAPILQEKTAPATSSDTMQPDSETTGIATYGKTRLPQEQPKKQAGTPGKDSGSGSKPKAEPAAQSGEFDDVAALDASIRLDIRYATTHNFTHARIYDCPRCLLRPAAAAAIVQAHRALQKKGLGLKMFDCYRPRPYQQRLWDKVPNPDYVTPPAKGSMHSRGAAVDLTIVDKNGKELDMGTEYDFFGKEAHTDYTGHSAQVQANRDLLRKTLEQVGFKGIRTEWWHFSFQGHDFPLSSYVWPCK